MSKKKTRKNEPPTALFEAKANDFKDRVNSDRFEDIDIDDFQALALLDSFDISMRNSFQLGFIQITLLVISVLLALHFFGWIVALVIGIFLGVIMLISLMVAFGPRLNSKKMDFLYDDEYKPRDDHEGHDD